MNKITFGIILGIIIIIGYICDFFDIIILMGLFVGIAEIMALDKSNIGLIGILIIIGAIILMHYGKKKDIILILLIIVISDIFQELIGKKYGKNKIGWVSPNKTYEGYIGGYIGILIFYFIYNHFSNITSRDINFIYINIIYLLGVMGDLFFSLIKRNAGVKDYSNILLSHGGVLDRLDSFIFALYIMCVTQL
jgi:phosphatidate cytidylyltransferase